MPLESAITRSILNYLNSLPGCIAEKVMGSSSASGRADINACYKGRTLRIEVKTPDHKNQASAKQEHNLEKWEKAGAVTMVVYNLEAVKDAISILEMKYQGIVDDHLSEHFVGTGDGRCVSWIKFPPLK